MPPDPKPTDTSPDEPETGPVDDDASDPEDDATTAPEDPTTEDDGGRRMTPTPVLAPTPAVPASTIFGREPAVIPPYIAEVLPLPGQTRRKIAVYTVVEGRITVKSAQTTGGILAACSPPQYIRAPGGGYKWLCQLRENAPRRIGKWIYGGFARVGTLP